MQQLTSNLSVSHFEVECKDSSRYQSFRIFELWNIVIANGNEKKNKFAIF